MKWNSPYINHFISPDTIIPDQTNPQSWDRYAYTFNNPIRYSDPSGHCPICLTAAIGGAVGGIVGAVGYTAYVAASGREFNASHFWMATAGGAAAGALIGTGIGWAAGVSTASATTAAVTAGGVAEAANVGCAGDMCAGETQQLGQTAQEVLPTVGNAASQLGDDVAQTVHNAAQQVSDALGGTLEPAAGAGWKVTLSEVAAKGNDVVVRIMEYSKVRTYPYYRVAVEHVGALDANGSFSMDPDLTHHALNLVNVSQSIQHMIELAKGVTVK